MFIVLIPIADEGEAEDYVARVQAACLAYEDEVIAPSVACGVVYKTLCNCKQIPFFYLSTQLSLVISFFLPLSYYLPKIRI